MSTMGDSPPPAVDSDSGSEYCPSDAPSRKQKTKKGKKGKKKAQNPPKTPPKVPHQLPSPPDTTDQVGQDQAYQQLYGPGFSSAPTVPAAPFFLSSLAPSQNNPINNQMVQENAFQNQQFNYQQKLSNSAFNIQQRLLQDIQKNTSQAIHKQELQKSASNTQQNTILHSTDQDLQENAFKTQENIIQAYNNQDLLEMGFRGQQILLPPNNTSECIQPSLLQDLSHSNGGSGLFEYKGGLYPRFDFEAAMQEGNLNMGGPFGDGSKWLDPIMPDGTRIEDDPAYQAYAAEIFNFEFEQAALLMGDPSSSAPSDASASFKTESTTMDNPFASTKDAESTTVTSERTTNSRAKAGSNASNNLGNIPLICMLCEKSPTFSDLSHLLTHVSSKSHLSRKFQLQLKGPTDPVVKLRLDQYDVWESMHGIQLLLTARQEAKEQKKETLLRRQRVPSKDKKARRSSNARENVKLEPQDSPQMPPAAPMQHYNPLNLQNQQNQQGWNSNGSYDISYQTPSHRRTRSEYPDLDTLAEPNALANQANEPDEPVETGRQAGSRTPTLKGIIYPGMDIFDAGTPDQKRMRNQKKDPSVIQSMMSDSRAITDIEFVWDSEMSNIERTRSVYDTPTDMSDELGPDHEEHEAPPKKPRVTRAAAPKTKPRVKTYVKAEPDSPEPTGPATSRLTRSAARSMNAGTARGARGGKQGRSRGGRKAVQQRIEEEEEWDSDGEIGIPQRKRGLSVYQEDAPDHGMLNGNMRGSGRQGAQDFNSNPFNNQQSNLGQRSAMQGLPTNRPLSSMYGRQNNQGFNLTDKDSGQNAFSLQQSMNETMQAGYYQPRQNLQGGGGYNPLCLQPQQSDSYNHANGTGFDVSKPLDAPFQSMNGLSYDRPHGLPVLTGDLHDLGNGMNGMANPMTQGMNTPMDAMDNALNNGMVNVMNHVMDNALHDGNNHNGTQFQSGNNLGQNNGFEIQ